MNCRMDRRRWLAIELGTVETRDEARVTANPSIATVGMGIGAPCGSTGGWLPDRESEVRTSHRPP